MLLLLFNPNLTYVGSKIRKSVSALFKTPNSCLLFWLWDISTFGKIETSFSKERLGIFMQLLDCCLTVLDLMEFTFRFTCMMLRTRSFPTCFCPFVNTVSWMMPVITAFMRIWTAKWLPYAPLLKWSILVGIPVNSEVVPNPINQQRIIGNLVSLKCKPSISKWLVNKPQTLDSY